ncbi:MAG: flagellin FliC [Chloroflexi bacterium]|nr:flagellin FliC [Chloroflexota bacterium]
MAVSEKLKNQVRGLNQAQRNAQDGISLIQTAEGGMGEIHSLLARMRELAVQAANDTLTTSDRANLNAEFTQLMTEITRVSNAVTFNGTYLLNNASTNVTLQLGANSTASTNQLSFALTNNTAAGTGIALTSNDVTSAANATLAITQLDTAIGTVSTNRANFGALQSRLESASRSLAVAAENTAAANSRVADADIASSMSELVRAQILQQAGISVLAQANQAPAMIIDLLK